MTLAALTGLMVAIHLRNISLIDLGAFAIGCVIVALATRWPRIISPAAPTHRSVAHAAHRQLT